MFFTKLSDAANSVWWWPHETVRRVSIKILLVQIYSIPNNIVSFFCSAHTDVAGTLSGHASWVLCVSFSEDGKHFASSSSDTTVKIWDFAERKCMHTFSEHSDQAWGVKYSLSNDKVVSVSEDKSLNLYNCPPNVVV